MKKYICFLFPIICISLNAQSDSLFQTKLTGEAFVEYRGFRGEQYFNAEWAESDILLSTKEMVHGAKLKYNGMFDEVVWLNTNIPGLYKLDRPLIKEFWLNKIASQPIHFKRINVNDSTMRHSDIYAEVAVEGKVSLYIQRKISVTDVLAIPHDGKLYPLKFIGPTPVYYVKFPTGTYSVMNRLSRRLFIKLFPEQKKLITRLVRQNDIDLRTENGLSEIINLLNKEVVN
jgi:hypothetical protein